MYGDVLNRQVTVTIDRPLGSVHPEHSDILYKLNYGYVDGVEGYDGEEQDAYIIDMPLPLPRLSEFSGYVVAVIVRKNDVETKWVVSTSYDKKYTREEIAEAVHFQEKFFDIEIIM